MPLSAVELVAELHNFDKSTIVNREEHFKLVEALERTKNRVSTTWMLGIDMCWTHDATICCVQTLINAGVWEKWLNKGAKPATSAELAQLAGIDQILLKRMLLHLAAQELVALLGPDTYGPTDFTRELGTSQYSSLFTYLSSFNRPAFANFPRFAQDTGFKNPTDPMSGNVMHLYKTPLFELFAKDPAIGGSFNNAMSIYSNAKTAWVDIFPIQELVASAKPSQPIVVDIGGGMGQDLIKVAAKCPGLPENSLILHDLPSVIEKASLQQPMTAKAADFFDSSTIAPGAAAYYMHCVLHDWSDVKAIEILKNIGAAMQKGYSRLLIHEQILDENKPDLRVTVSDITMLACTDAAERTKVTWHELVTKAGMRIVKVHSLAEAFESVMEVELV